jgi:hypothetical protein
LRGVKELLGLVAKGDGYRRLSVANHVEAARQIVATVDPVVCQNL